MRKFPTRWRSDLSIFYQLRIFLDPSDPEKRRTESHAGIFPSHLSQFNAEFTALRARCFKLLLNSLYTALYLCSIRCVPIRMCGQAKNFVNLMFKATCPRGPDRYIGRCCSILDSFLTFHVC